MYGKPDQPNGSLCMDCGVNTSTVREFYMLRDEIWLRAADSVNGMLCIECVEARLGRRLRPSDFDLQWDFMNVEGLSSVVRTRVLGLPDPYRRVTS